MNVYLLRRKGESKETCNGIVEFMDAKVIREDRISRMVFPNIIFRWGSTVAVNSGFEINTPSMIHKMNNKITSRKALKDANIPVPITFYSKEEALNSNVFPLIGRKTFHSQGKGMVISHNREELELDTSSTYWSSFIDKDKEFRVYVFFGRVLGVSKKIPSDPTEIAWNNSLGNAMFETIKWDYFPLTACKLALQSCKILGVDFSAVDILKKGNDNFVIELNSSPTMSPYRQKLFAKGFNWVIEQVIKNNKLPNHFNLPDCVRNYKDIIFPGLLGETNVRETTS